MTDAGQSRTALLLADANILIDLAQAGGLGLIGELSRHRIAEVYVPRTIYDEVATEVSETEIADLGITILAVSRELTARALAYPDARLSPSDRELLLMAVENGYGVWTNDKRLRANCERNGVAVYWEFEALLNLVSLGHLAKDALVALARKVADNNPYLKGIADDMENAL